MPTVERLERFEVSLARTIVRLLEESSLLADNLAWRIADRLAALPLDGGRQISSENDNASFGVNRPSELSNYLNDHGFGADDGIPSRISTLAEVERAITWTGDLICDARHTFPGAIDRADVGEQRVRTFDALPVVYGSEGKKGSPKDTGSPKNQTSKSGKTSDAVAKAVREAGAFHAVQPVNGNIASGLERSKPVAPEERSKTWQNWMKMVDLAAPQPCGVKSLEDRRADELLGGRHTFNGFSSRADVPSQLGGRKKGHKKAGGVAHGSSKPPSGWKNYNAQRSQLADSVGLSSSSHLLDAHMQKPSRPQLLEEHHGLSGRQLYDCEQEDLGLTREAMDLSPPFGAVPKHPPPPPTLPIPLRVEVALTTGEDHIPHNPSTATRERAINEGPWTTIALDERKVIDPVPLATALDRKLNRSQSLSNVEQSCDYSAGLLEPDSPPLRKSRSATDEGLTGVPPANPDSPGRFMDHRCFDRAQSLTQHAASEWRRKGSKDSEGSGEQTHFVIRNLRAARQKISTSCTEVQMLRHAREAELTNTIIQDSKIVFNEGESTISGRFTESEESDENYPSTTDEIRYEQAYPSAGTPLCLRLLGAVAPHGQCSRLLWYIYSILVHAVAILCIAAFVIDANYAPSVAGVDNSEFVQFRHLSDLSLALGNFFGLVTLRAVTCSDLLGNSESLLVSYARRQGVVATWSRSSLQQMLVLSLLWILAVIARCFVLYDRIHEGVVSAVISTGAFVVASGFFMLISHGLLHVSSALTVMIDAYCFRFVEEPNLDLSVREWNMLQAVLRKASCSVEFTFSVLQTTALVVLLLIMAGFYLRGSEDIWYLLSMLPLALGDIRLFFKAAEITEKCTRVPALINSLSFGLDVDRGRHYLVEYVSYSAAGFYVGEVRLTQAMALKLTYISGLAAFGVLTKVTSGY